MRRLGGGWRVVAGVALWWLALAPVCAVGGAGGARAADEVFFPQTGLTLSNAHGFLDYWNAHGGLAQFGYPRTPEILEANPADGKLYTVQWFERNRFEWHPEFAGTPYEVELGLLGVQLTLDRRKEGPFQRVPEPQIPGQVYFPETGHTLRNSFKTYWEQHGGLAIYGYPISEEFTETSPTDGKPYVVQYFERNRFEWHPEYKGTPYEVLLGLLGNTIVGDPQAPAVPDASVPVRLAVAPQFRVGPFTADRTLTLPPGFSANVFAAGLAAPRFMAVAPNGDLFVSEKAYGKIIVLPDRDRDGVADSFREYATGLAKPHGLAFHDGYLYVAQEASVIRFRYQDGDLAARGPAETVVPNLPSGGPATGLVGDVTHDTRTIVFGADGKIYVSVGSDCDVCVESDPHRAAVLQFNADGSGGRVYASGLRNAVGLGVDPRTGLLWATLNERNALGPDRPPDFFLPLRDGVDYGWPTCIATNPPTPDPQFGAGKDEYCRTRVQPGLVPLRAHTTPLGMTFYEGGKLPAPFANGVFIAEHGPYGDNPQYGHRIVFVSMVPGRLQQGPHD
ncbi:MAG TPA: PQQ-dependent sugar dehydrogenase, partial [Thermomicrobiales bacterium]|nr:PQQ-dependent sugar dehydrogenase [Thermomicrobiales bacterium]